MQLLKCWYISLRNTQKSYLAIPPANPSEKSLGTVKLSSSWRQIKVAPNLKFYLKAQILSPAINIVNCVLEVTSSCHWLLSQFLPNTQTRITIVYQRIVFFFSSKKQCFFAEGNKGRPFSLQLKLMHRCFPWDKHRRLFGSRRALFVLLSRSADARSRVEV